VHRLFVSGVSLQSRLAVVNAVLRLWCLTWDAAAGPLIFGNRRG